MTGLKKGTITAHIHRNELLNNRTLKANLEAVTYSKAEAIETYHVLRKIGKKKRAQKSKLQENHKSSLLNSHRHQR